MFPACDAHEWVEAGPGTLHDVLERGVLRFGYSEEAPYVYHAENGELAGIDWGLGNGLTTLIRDHYTGYAPGKGLRAEWIKNWTSDALFMCVVNEGPSKTNTEALVKAIGDRAKLSYGNLQQITDAVAKPTIHFSVGDPVLSGWLGVQPRFKGLNLNIAAAVDVAGTAQPVAAFTLKNTN